jgi:hypothetical protein
LQAAGAAYAAARRAGAPAAAARGRRRAAVRMVEASIALFARFGGDAGVGELLSMLT